MSQRRIKDVLAEDALDQEKEQFFDPLEIPAPGEKESNAIRAYRMSQAQYSTVVSTLALFNGSHNFHNYIGGSVVDDERCFINIFNIEASPLEILEGVEWIRIKVQASGFARDQIRRMIGMLGIFTIRHAYNCNTHEYSSLCCWK
jgi:tRNA pseudouridine(38-40) synthase